MATKAKASFHWDDPLLLDQQLMDDERAVREAARAYAQDRLLPRVTEAFRHGTTDAAIFREMGELGLLGPTIPEQYGGPGLHYVSYGLIAREVVCLALLPFQLARLGTRKASAPGPVTS